MTWGRPYGIYSNLKEKEETNGATTGVKENGSQGWPESESASAVGNE